MPRKTNTDKKRDSRGGRTGTMEKRTPRPKPKIDFTVDALDYKNTTLLKQFVTDQGRILPRKYLRARSLSIFQKRRSTAYRGWSPTRSFSFLFI